MLDSFFHPSSIVVVGASRDSKKVGHQILKNLLKDKVDKIFAVNPSAHSILGVETYPTLTEIPSHVDLVIIAVPAPFVEQVVDDSIKKVVKAIVIITASFAEMSKEGKEVQDRIADKLRKNDIPFVGPNSLGFLYPSSEINASFADQKITSGTLALISQSGAMLTALFTEMESNQVGSSFAISLGNKAGISEIEALQFAWKDKQTRVIGAYLESFSDLPQFFELASKVSKEKPLILLKGGRTKTGQTASVSHTAALATDDVLLKAASKQFGFVMVDTVEEFVQTIFFLEKQKHLAENVMIITNAGGPGVNTVDISEMKELSLAVWSSTSQQKLQELLPQSHITNPLDVIGDATAERFSLAIRQAQVDPQIDSIVVIITQQSVTNIPEIVQMLMNIKGRKPIGVALMGGDKFDQHRRRLRDTGIYCTEFPNDLISMLSIVRKSAQAKFIPEKFEALPVETASRYHSTHANIATDIHQAFTLLSKYGFQSPIYSLISEAKHLSQVHVPSYSKTGNLALPHKKDVGAIYGVVKEPKQLLESFKQLKPFGETVLYQEIIQADVELLLGINRDPQFGPYIAIGLGGSFTNVLSDRSYVFLPTTKRIMLESLKTTKAFLALEKLSEEYKKNLANKIVTCMLQLQTLMHDHPEIIELEINPLMINKEGVWAADVKVKINS